jgi:hypothetical protein
MTDTSRPGAPDRGRLLILSALAATVALLAGILFMLVLISRNGISIHLGGDISLSDASDRISVELSMNEPLVLTMPEPAHLVATGPEGNAIPAALSLAVCPHCGGSMLPGKWNLWTGEIEWVCPACGQVDVRSPAP